MKEEGRLVSIPDRPREGAGVAASCRSKRERRDAQIAFIS